MQIEGREIRVSKFGNIGSSSGDNTPLECLEGTRNQGEDGDSDADDRQERKEARLVRNLINKVAKSPPNKNAPYTTPVPDSLVGRSGEEFGHRNLWVNWKQDVVLPREVGWREEFANAEADEGDPIDIKDDDHIWSYFATPTGNLPRGMIR